MSAKLQTLLSYVNKTTASLNLDDSNMSIKIKVLSDNWNIFDAVAKENKRGNDEIIQKCAGYLSQFSAQYIIKSKKLNLLHDDLIVLGDCCSRAVDKKNINFMLTNLTSTQFDKLVKYIGEAIFSWLEIADVRKEDSLVTLKDLLTKEMFVGVIHSLESSPNRIFELV